LNQENHSYVCVFIMTLSLNALLSISCISDAVFPSLKQNLTQMCWSFKSAIRKLQIVLNMHKNKCPLRSNAEGYGSKTHYTYIEYSNTTAPSCRKLYYLMFLVIAVSLGTLNTPLYAPPKCSINL
jgi:hypothetical protein